MRIATFLTVAILLCPATAGASVMYTVTDLGIIAGPGYSAVPFAINNQGQAAGWSTTMSGMHAVVWENGSISDLGTLGGTESIAYGMNNAGQVVGISDAPSGGHHPFLWDGSVMRDLDPTGQLGAQAFGINDRGEVVGTSLGTGFIWRDGSYHYLAGVSQAEDINNVGQVVGGYMSDHHHAVMWQNGTTTDLGVLGPEQWSTSHAYDVNNHGAAIGVSTVVGGYHAFLWQDGTMLDLGVMQGGHNSRALGVNDVGQVVGYGDTGEPGVTGRPFIWQDGTMTNLQTLMVPGNEWRLYTAYGINDSGQIIATGSRGFGDHAVLLTPVPEPSSLLALFCGVAASGGLAALRGDRRVRLFRRGA